MQTQIILTFSKHFFEHKIHFVLIIYYNVSGIYPRVPLIYAPAGNTSIILYAIISTHGHAYKTCRIGFLIERKNGRKIRENYNIHDYYRRTLNTIVAGRTHKYKIIFITNNLVVGGGTSNRYPNLRRFAYSPINYRTRRGS